MPEWLGTAIAFLRRVVGTGGRSLEPNEGGLALTATKTLRPKTYQSRKGKLPHKQIGVVLVSPNLLERKGAWTISPLLALRNRIAGCSAG